MVMELLSKEINKSAMEYWMSLLRSDKKPTPGVDARAICTRGVLYLIRRGKIRMWI